MKTKNVFAGANAVMDYLNPDENPMIPLVELPSELNQFASDRVRVFAKLMNTLPLGNVKSLPALNMLLDAKKTGKLDSVHTLIENSSGNTVFSLATIARLMGIQKTIAIVSNEVSRGKLELLRLLGTSIEVNEEPICPDPNDKTSGIYKAAQRGKEQGWFNPGQYDNPANPDAHYRWTAPQIWEQTNGEITVFCSGVGTTGTIVGIGSYLKEKSKRVAVVGVARSPNNPVPGVRTKNLLRQIAFDWEGVVDSLEIIGTRESFEQSLAMCRSGLMVGPSSGFALAGLNAYLAKKKEGGTLDELRNERGEILIVFICPDSPLPYVSEYFEYLTPEHFPEIKNEELLLNHDVLATQPLPNSNVDSTELNAADAYQVLYKTSPEDAWEKINKGNEPRLRRGVVLLDVRAPEEFMDAHLPSAENHNHIDILRDVESHAKRLMKKKVVAICRSGSRSALVTRLLKERGVDILNLEGGMIEWSRLNLPRIQPNICL